MVNPRFIVSPDRFAVEGRHSFLVTGATEGDGRFAAQLSPGFDHEVLPLTQIILNRQKGLPPRTPDLPEPS